MCPDVLTALANIMIHHDNDVSAYLTRYGIRINSVGEKLELFLKDAVVDSFKIAEPAKTQSHQAVFSYLGNQNNPPDFIIKGSDAFEVKKAQGYGEIQLNSSPPKDRLHSTDSRISKDCRECEKWSEKDLFYVIGIMEKDILNDLFFVHGRCYCAEDTVYEKASKSIEMGVKNLIKENGWEAADTNELGRINKVDPLGITSLRIRGMWLIKNPFTVFSKILLPNKGKGFRLHCLMTEDKYNSYPFTSRNALTNNGLTISQINVLNPNNLAKNINSIMVSGSW